MRTRAAAISQFQFRCLLLYNHFVCTFSCLISNVFNFYITRMSWTPLTFCLVLLIMAHHMKAASITSCIKSSRDCVQSSECCTGCCHNNKCVEFNESCLGFLDKIGGGNKGDLCNPPCTRGKSCLLQPVQCVAYPCQPIPSCIPEEYKDYDN